MSSNIVSSASAASPAVAAEATALIAKAKDVIKQQNLLLYNRPMNFVEKVNAVIKKARSYQKNLLALLDASPNKISVHIKFRIQHLCCTLVSNIERLNEVVLTLHTKNIASGSGLQHNDRNVKWDNGPTSFHMRAQTGIITNLKHKDIKAFFKDALELFIKNIEKILKKLIAVKVHANLICKFSIIKNDELIIDEKSFNTKANIIQRTTDLSEWFDENIVQPILEEMEEYEGAGSGYTLHSIFQLILGINKLVLMHA